MDPRREDIGQYSHNMHYLEHMLVLLAHAKFTIKMFGWLLGCCKADAKVFLMTARVSWVVSKVLQRGF